MSEKLVSIIIPFYNRINWLLEAIESVQKQTYKNWELILVNDGSADDITEIRYLVEKDRRIRLIEQENAGVAAARNAGIAIAEGYYIALLDSDDLWDRQKLEKQIAYMEKHNYLVSHTNYILFNDNGNVEEVDNSSFRGDILSAIMVSCPLNTSSVVFCKSLLADRKEPFPVGFHFGEDACFWIMLAAQTAMGAMAEPLTLTRQSDTRAADDIYKVRLAVANILSYCLRDPYLSGLDCEINQLSKNIAILTSGIEMQQQQINNLEEKLHKLKPIREKLKREFDAAGFYPKVSIIIPVYNGVNYMCQAIESALLQTYGNIEVIVVNDGSTDGGATAQTAFIYRDKIRYFSKPNGGVATALNLGIEKMEGEYFSWLSHDDMYSPTKIEEEVRCLAKQSDPATLIAEGYQVVNSAGEYMYTVNIHSLYDKGRLANPLFVLMRGGINGCAMLIHKSHFERVGVFDPALPTTQDYDLWFRMFRGQAFCYMKTANVLSRSHEEQGSKALLFDHVKECDELWIGMMEKLTVAEKCNMCGSEFQFYQELWDFLHKNTGYNQAISFAKKRMLECAFNDYEKSWDKKSLNTLAECCGVSVNYLKNKIIPLRKSKSSKQRLVFQFIERNNKGGLNRIVVETANILSRAYDVVICTWGEPFVNGYMSCGEVCELAIDFTPNDIEEYMNLLAFIKTDVYIFSHCCAEEYLMSILERVSWLGIKSIAWSHEDYFLPYWRESLHSCLPGRKKYLPKANAVVWLNSTSHAIYSAQQDNGVCIPNQADYVEISEPGTKRENVLLAIGRYDDGRKGLGDLLRIFVQIHKRRPNTELYIVGGVDLQLQVPGLPGVTCEEYIRSEGLTEQQLHLVGWTENVKKYYQIASLHIMPSLYEGFGLVVLEAAAYGVPTVAYDGSGMQDIITDDYDGILTKCGDWEKMSDAILKLMNDHPKIDAMRRHLPNMLQRYNKNTIMQKWQELFTAILSDDKEVLDEYFQKNRSSCLPQAAAKAVEEYEKRIAYPVQYYDEVWHQECLNMQKSLSWRITKPLRLSKKVVKSLRQNGVRATVNKIKYKLRNR